MDPNLPENNRTEILSLIKYLNQVLIKRIDTLEATVYTIQTNNRKHFDIEIDDSESGQDSDVEF